MLGYLDFGEIFCLLYYALQSAIKKMSYEISDISCSEIDYDKQGITFRQELPQPLLPGHCIDVNGVIYNQCERFSVNFLCRETDPDIAFHFNPRLSERYVVRNSKRRGRWDQEETTSYIQPNFSHNESFNLSFFIAPTKFMVAINEEHFCSFKYRIPLTKVYYLEVCGDVKVNDVKITEMTDYPKHSNVFNIPYKIYRSQSIEINRDIRRSTPTLFFTTNNDDDMEDKMSLPQNPFIGYLTEGFKNGWQLEIRGKVKLLPHSFFINLQDGTKLWPQPNIPLHLNPRFNMTLVSHIFIRNTREKGVWGLEERAPGFNFEPSKHFQLIIQLDEDRDMFVVWVNDKLEGEFRIRNKYDVKHINTVYIQGDVTIYNICVEKSFST